MGQYRIASFIILRHSRELEWIRIADPEAGRVDDFQIGTRNRVDGFQVKWSRYPGSISFKDLIRASNAMPSLIAQLARGWEHLRENHPGRRIVVHLITNDMPSVRDRPPVQGRPPIPDHFAAFYDQAWKRGRGEVEGLDQTIPGVWRPAWEALQQASDLAPATFQAFVKDCELEFGHRAPGSGTSITEDETSTLADLKRITLSLFEAVADPARIINLTRDELLKRLGWTGRLQFRNPHEFPEPPIPYEPIEATQQRLDHALSALTGGYIAVLGAPGSGKSTLLTRAPRHSSYGYDSPADDWLALSPELGIQLGWRVAADGLFRWVDGEGQVMVESIWWMDGLVDRPPPHFDDEVGEGWLVVASQTAWDAIRSRLGFLERAVEIERSFLQDGQRVQRRASSKSVISV